MRPDSLAMFIHQPYANIVQPWPEHLKGEVVFRTNNLGFREDEDIEERVNIGTRILVTGDSHTDGVLYNEESFANVLESSLSDSSIDVINGGTGFYSFRNYNGFLDKFKSLKPDYFIVNVFIGNDFRETLLYEDESDTYSNIVKNAYQRASRKLFMETRLDYPLNQGLDQVYYFKLFPSDRKKALDLAQLYTRKLDSLCAQNETKLIVTLLPSKLEVNDEFKNQIQKNTGWTDQITDVNNDLTDSYISFLNEEGIRFYDFRKFFSESEDKLYWDEDHHINVTAHKLIGEFLSEELKEELLN